ncbi:hypothetical protein GOEFS_023_00160 [Gordonia effusa NBRC 100432]|uniref:Uncharacterized protein n=1 Tax=Gordonia effusa NBRC 100432 TaxID=1077974 RepID=H0QWU8_9ACTN|nr:hypothetical protein [Gordonia effusa]GAB17299.1 hypothetical protein GOEFS_023_00160 [Gordonia effusa NBRC 100432]
MRATNYLAALGLSKVAGLAGTQVEQMAWARVEWTRVDWAAVGRCAAAADRIGEGRQWEQGRCPAAVHRDQLASEDERARQERHSTDEVGRDWVWACSGLVPDDRQGADHNVAANRVGEVPGPELSFPVPGCPAAEDLLAVAVGLADPRCLLSSVSNYLLGAEGGEMSSIRGGAGATGGNSVRLRRARENAAAPAASSAATAARRADFDCIPIPCQIDGSLAISWSDPGPDARPLRRVVG